MAYTLSFRTSPARYLLLALPLTMLLSGCCANDECNCADEKEDAITFRFSSAFSRADLDTVLVLRTPLPYNPTNKVESVTLIRSTARGLDSLQINNDVPFARVGATKLNGYRYEVQYLVQAPRSKPVPTRLLVIDSVRLEGSLEGDGCCTCYTNTEKTVYGTRPKRSSAAADSTFVSNLKEPQTGVIRLTK